MAECRKGLIRKGNPGAGGGFVVVAEPGRALKPRAPNPKAPRENPGKSTVYGFPAGRTDARARGGRVPRGGYTVTVYDSDPGWEKYDRQDPNSARTRAGMDQNVNFLDVSRANFGGLLTNSVNIPYCETR